MAILGFLVVALAAFAYAQKLEDCSGSCVGKAIQATGCPSIKSHCICESPVFMETVQTCVATECGADQQEAAVSFAEDFCGTVTTTKAELKREADVHHRRLRNKRSVWGDQGSFLPGHQVPGHYNPSPPVNRLPQPYRPEPYKPGPPPPEHTVF